MLYSFLKGKGVFVFSVLGGAKPLLSLVLAIKSRISDYRIISDRNYSFFGDFGLPVVAPPVKIDDLFQQFKPDFLIIGTSYTSKIEIEYLVVSKTVVLKSFSFVDH